MYLASDCALLAGGVIPIGNMPALRRSVHLDNISPIVMSSSILAGAEPPTSNSSTYQISNSFLLPEHGGWSLHSEGNAAHPMKASC